jgi:hypothetical protein
MSRQIFPILILSYFCLSFPTQAREIKLSHSQPQLIATIMQECVVGKYNRGVTIDEAAQSCSSQYLSDNTPNCTISLMGMGIQNYTAAEYCSRGNISNGQSWKDCTNRLIYLGIQEKDAEEFCY